MDRLIKDALLKDLGRKILLISGPRQCGKTTLAKALKTHSEYFNYDHAADRKKIQAEHWDRSRDLLILDELHKMKNWKRWLKGVYDTGAGLPILVTGSAKLDTYRRAGDSLAGRFFQFRLMPLDVKEASLKLGGEPEKHLEGLLKRSGFPEPFLSDSESFYKRWRETHLDVILKQDVFALESIRRIQDLGTLVELMRDRIGSTLSYTSLREDLQTDDKTIKRWMLALENCYVFFKVTPYSDNIKYSLAKAPKYYFFDIPRVVDEGARLENAVAFSLYKEILYRKDVDGDDYALHFVRTKQDKEIDFLVTLDRKPVLAVEVKLSDESPSPNFRLLEGKKFSPSLQRVQLVKNLKREFTTKEGVQVRNAAQWLARMEF